MSKSKAKQNKKNIAYAATVFVLLAIISFFVARKMQLYNTVVDQSATVSIRELIIQAARGTKKSAPIDAKTGDIYFPEAKLFLPYSPDTALTTLTYAYDAEGKELSISTTAAFNQSIIPLYNAKNVAGVFDAVPKLQSCQRGIRLAHTEAEFDNIETELRQTVPLSNGETLYVYTESLCPELGGLADLLKNLKSY